MPVESVWDRLQVEGEAAGQYVRLRIGEVTACPVYAARRTTDGREAVIIEVHKRAIPGDVQYPDSRGFHVSAGPLVEGRSGATRLTLSLVDIRYRDVFFTLASDLFNVLSGVTGERAAVETFVSRLSRWQAFLRRHGPEGLSPEARRGLFGELVILNDLLIPRLGTSSVNGWSGPSGASHDFELPRGSVEVKTTSAATPSEFRINNVLQLDDSHSRVLYLILVLVQESESAGRSLPDLIASIREILGGGDLEKFDDLLIDAGYLERHVYLYRVPRYVLRSMRVFKLGDGFPRILESMVPFGVTDVAYSVAVAACLPFLCEVEALISSLIESSGSG